MSGDEATPDGVATGSHAGIQGAEPILATVRGLLTGHSRALLVGIDGPSGSRKSTIARAVAAAFGATVVPGDDFFAAALTDADWASRSAAERAADAID